jgi:hypothetical protein
MAATAASYVTTLGHDALDRPMAGASRRARVAAFRVRQPAGFGA